jgi:hypothetical protein
MTHHAGRDRGWSRAVSGCDGAASDDTLAEVQAVPTELIGRCAKESCKTWR